MSFETDLENIIRNVLSLKLPSYFKVRGYEPTGGPREDRKSQIDLKIPSFQYFYYIYQAMISLGDQDVLLKRYENKKREYPYLIEIIHNMADVPINCINTIYFNIEDETVRAENGLYKEYREVLPILVKKFIDISTKGKCLNTSIDLVLETAIDCHQNILFVEFGNPIKLYLYEPYGSFRSTTEVGKIIIKFVKDFGAEIKKQTNTTTRVVPTHSVSCQVGIQSRIKRDVGFCVIVSFFWLYCVLILSKKYPLQEVLEKTEPRIISIVEKISAKDRDKSISSSQVMENLIVKFSALVTNFTIEVMQKIPNYYRFEKEVFEFIRDERRYPIKDFEDT